MKRNIFLDQMKQKLETDLRSDKYGCRIAPVNVRLGSGIRIDKFYEAELLFHNFSNVQKFAYLIARDIVANMSKFDPKKSIIVLLGYENYSSILVQEIKRLLVEKLGQKVEDGILCLIDSNSSKKYPCVSFDSLDNNEREKIKEQLNFEDTGARIYCYTIIPIGSTMSTVYKLHNSFVRGICTLKNTSLNDEEAKEHIRQQVNFKDNYCVVAVGNAYVPNENEEFNMSDYEIERKYIMDIACKDDFFFNVNLQKERKDTEPISVKCLLGVPAKWFDSKYIEIESELPLVQVDKTSTLIDISFQSKLPDDVLQFYKKESRIDSLDSKSNLVKHGHICKGDNHYEFFFDFEKITILLRNEIKKWAKEIKIEQDAYNIVISPLQLSNASFLKLIIDSIFGSSLHLLHIDINSTGKENIRTKFSYICEELQSIKRVYSKVNFYYVDDSICTGSTISRAYKFLQMLCDQATIKVSDINGGKDLFKFEKVFLLVNRSSYETAHIWVNNPNNDWLGYINICIPSYNTHSNICPGCITRDRFVSLAKRSASGELAQHFYNNAEKHKCRTPEEFDMWQNNEMLTNPSYFQWFYRWLESFSRTKKPDYEKHRKVFKKINTFLKDKDKVNEQTNKDFLDFSEDDEDIKTLITQMISEEHFRRLRTMNDAYQKMIYDKVLQDLYYKCANSKDNKYDDYEKAIKEKIKEMLKSCFDDEKTNYNNVMDYISYIKVISRNNLVKNFFVKKAIIEIMKDEIFDLINEKRINNKNKTEKAIDLNIYFIFRMYKVLSHRLALLHSEKVIDVYFINNILKFYEKYNISKSMIIGVPNENALFNDYVASIKTVTTIEKDEAMLCKLNNLTVSLNIVLKRYKNLKSSNNILEFVSKIKLENTAMIYDFIRDLSDRCTNFSDEIDINWKYKGYNGLGGLQKRFKIKEQTSKTVVEHLSNAKEDNSILYQNPFSSYFGFFEKNNSNRILKNDFGTFDNFGVLDKGIIKSDLVSHIVHYFNILRYLTHLDLEKKRKGSDYYQSLPYIYEDLCFSISEVMECHSCYLLYYEKGETVELVSRNGYSTNFGDDDLLSSMNIKDSNLDSLIKKFEYGKEEYEKGFFEKSVCCKTHIITDEIKIIKTVQPNNDAVIRHYFGVIRIPFYKNETKEEKNSERYFFIVLEDFSRNNSKKIKLGKNTMIKRAQRIVFLRELLLIALKSNYAELIDFRYNCGYIKSIRDDKSMNRNSEIYLYPHIMHISDLHIENVITKELDFSPELRHVIDNKCQGIDLLAITGDIINAGQNAKDAQDKYKNAKKVILEISKVLWAYNDFLPHDWKRRVLIVPGNHDYTAMNDVSIELDKRNESRRIKAGFPAMKSGGTMSKFTYYIEFLMDFLDAPIHELVPNDMNEVRIYENLNVFIGMFNTVSKSNSLQTNKVAVNREKIARLIKTSNWNRADKNKRIVLMHHSPQYSINYFDDKYEPNCLEKYGNFHDLYKSFIDYLNDPSTPESKKTKNDLKNFISSFNVFTSKMSDLSIDDYKKIKDSLVYSDMNLLYDGLKSNNQESDEFFQTLLFKSQQLLKIQERDNVAFQDFINSLLFDIALAGHIHEMMDNKDPHPTFIVSKLYDTKLYQTCCQKIKYNKISMCFELIDCGIPNKQEHTLFIDLFFKNNSLL